MFCVGYVLMVVWFVILCELQCGECDVEQFYLQEDVFLVECMCELCYCWCEQYDGYVLCGIEQC